MLDTTEDLIRENKQRVYRYLKCSLQVIDDYRNKDVEIQGLTHSLEWLMYRMEEENDKGHGAWLDAYYEHFYSIFDKCEFYIIDEKECFSKEEQAIIDAANNALEGLIQEKMKQYEPYFDEYEIFLLEKEFGEIPSK